MIQQAKRPELEDMVTDIGQQYDSKEESQIGQMLNQYGIPFFYKQPTIIYNQNNNEIWHPSFTLPQYGCDIIDYIAEQKHTSERISIYNYNQIPAVVLGPKDMKNPNWEKLLYQKIEQAYCHLSEEIDYNVPFNNE